MEEKDDGIQQKADNRKSKCNDKGSSANGRCLAGLSQRCQRLIMVYQTMGAVYGGLGTCPLYVFSSINIETTSERDYLGILSIIFWTLTLIGGFKYILVVLHANDRGEGGTFALYSLLCQYAKIGNDNYDLKAIPMESDIPLSWNLNGHNENVVHKKLKDFMESNKGCRGALFFVTMLATCMMIGDGIVSPAISVLSAIGGLQSVDPSFNQNAIVGISIILLLILFLPQKYGTHHISFVFSPIVVLWLLATPMIGIYNIFSYYPNVFKAISPFYMMDFFYRHGRQGWVTLGGTALCITGAEAIFADLGHFDRLSLQMGFVFGVYPSNLITYAGQAAYLIKNPHCHQDAFYSSIPTPLFWPMMMLSTLAAIVGSQGLISSCFSLVKQSVALDYFPRVQLIHTSKEHEGQVYSPEVNYFLMALCIAIVLGFRKASALGSAYGVTVMVVMLITTFLMTLVMLVVWRKNVGLALSFLFLFTIIEGSYVSAVLLKFPNGGWFPFLISFLLATMVLCWVYGMNKKCEHEKSNTISFVELGHLLEKKDNLCVPGLCLFMCNGIEMHSPLLVRHYLNTTHSLHRVIVLMDMICVREQPSILDKERFLYKRITSSHKGVYMCIVRYGFAEPSMEWNKFIKALVEKLRVYIQSEVRPSDEEEVFMVDGVTHVEVEVVEQEVEVKAVEKAHEEGVVCVVGREEVRANPSLNGMVQRWVIDKVFGCMHATYGRTTAESRLLATVPTSSLLDITMLYEV